LLLKATHPLFSGVFSSPDKQAQQNKHPPQNQGNGHLDFTFSLSGEKNWRDKNRQRPGTNHKDTDNLAEVAIDKASLTWLAAAITWAVFMNAHTHPQPKA